MRLRIVFNLGLILMGIGLGMQIKAWMWVNRQAVTCLGDGFHQRYDEFHIKNGQTVDWFYGVVIDGAVQKAIIDEGGVLRHQADLVIGTTTPDTTIVCVVPENRWTDGMRDCVSLGWVRQQVWTRQ